MRIAAILVPLLLVARAGAEKPAPYASAALGFTATFPMPAKEHLEADGSGTAAAVDPAGIMYMVGMLPSPPDVQKQPVKDQLDAGIAGAVEKVHGTIASQKEVKLGKYPGREAEIALQGGHATFRFFIVGARAYMIGVVHKDGVALPMPPAEFFASFKLKK